MRSTNTFQETVRIDICCKITNVREFYYRNTGSYRNWMTDVVTGAGDFSMFGSTKKWLVYTQVQSNLVQENTTNE